MAASLNSILATLQNGVSAINGLRTRIATTFPQVGTVSSAAGSVGAISFTSSQATGFLAVTTSSGAVGYVALYPSS
jgi:hypothetical protein